MSNEREVMARCAAVIQQHPAGLLTTIDAEGMPRSRYMTAGLVSNKVDQLYCLTVQDGRKVQQLRENPSVCWVFADEALGEIVTLYGQARVLDETTGVGQYLWDRLIRHAEAYSFDMLGRQEGSGYQFIEMQVRALEYLNPAGGQMQPQRIELSAGEEAAC